MICDIGELRPGTPERISVANGVQSPATHRHLRVSSGTRSLTASGPWENVGDDPDEAIAPCERKQAHFEALGANRRSSSRPSPRQASRCRRSVLAVNLGDDEGRFYEKVTKLVSMPLDR